MYIYSIYTIYMKTISEKISVKSKKISTLISLDSNVKQKAQKVAESINMPLSTIVNNYLYHFSRNKEIAFEYPSPKLIKMIEDGKKDFKKGNVSPAFSSTKDAMKWLNAQ
jgi:antitoxin component of RelBE/YafQ-DinJ toxin-antitoxin module